jgi:hypothetical protein
MDQSYWWKIYTHHSSSHEREKRISTAAKCKAFDGKHVQAFKLLVDTAINLVLYEDHDVILFIQYSLYFCGDDGSLRPFVFLFLQMVFL